MGMTTHERRQSLGRLNGRAAAVESAVYGISKSISSSERSNDFESAQKSFNFSSCPLALQTLQHFAEHQIADHDFFRAEGGVQASDVARPASVNKINPHTAIDYDHLVPRPWRLRARLPRQRYL